MVTSDASHKTRNDAQDKCNNGDRLVNDSPWLASQLPLIKAPAALAMLSTCSLPAVAPKCVEMIDCIQEMALRQQRPKQRIHLRPVGCSRSLSPSCLLHSAPIASCSAVVQRQRIMYFLLLSSESKFDAESRLRRREDERTNEGQRRRTSVISGQSLPPFPSTALLLFSLC